MKDNILKEYKNIILYNAFKDGWSIYKKDDNRFFLVKKKQKNEKFNLENDIILLHKDVSNLNKQN